MTDLDRLKARLARLADTPDPINGTARTLVNAGMLDPSMAMQREIMETQLPRSLTFINDRKDMLVFHVKAGRIAAVADAPHCSAPDRDIVGLALSGADACQKERLRGIINEFLKYAIGLSVISSSHAPDMSPAVTGIGPIECFSDFLRNEKMAEPVKISPTLKDFLALCSDIATAWIWVQESENYNRHGDPARLSKLNELAQNEVAERVILRTNAAVTPINNRCMIISGTGLDADAILSGNLGSSLIFMSFPAPDVTKIIDIWSSVLTQRTKGRPGEPRLELRA